MKPIQINKTTVKCDKCDWSQESSDIYEWLDKTCPKCSDCIVITQQDIDAYLRLISTMDVLNTTFGEIEPKGTPVKISVNSRDI